MFYDKMDLDELRRMVQKLKDRSDKHVLLAVAGGVLLFVAIAAAIVWKLKCRDDEMWLSDDDFEDLYDDDEDDDCDEGCCCHKPHDDEPPVH